MPEIAVALRYGLDAAVAVVHGEVQRRRAVAAHIVCRQVGWCIC